MKLVFAICQDPIFLQRRKKAQYTFLNNIEEILPVLYKLLEEHTRENTYCLTPENVSIEFQRQAMAYMETTDHNGV